LEKGKLKLPMADTNKANRKVESRKREPVNGTQISFMRNKINEKIIGNLLKN